MKEFRGTCVENPFGSIGDLCTVVENAVRITKRTFFKHCCVHSEIVAQMKQYPNDYEFFNRQNIYFYAWSAIEHFYW